MCNSLRAFAFAHILNGPPLLPYALSDPRSFPLYFHFLRRACVSISPAFVLTPMSASTPRSPLRLQSATPPVCPLPRIDQFSPSMGAQPPPSHLPTPHHHHQSISLGPAAPLPPPPSSNGAPPTPSGPPGSSVAQATPKLPPTPSAGPPYTNGPGGPGPGGPGQGPGQEGANGVAGELYFVFCVLCVLFRSHELLTNSSSSLFFLLIRASTCPRHRPATVPAHTHRVVVRRRGAGWRRAGRNTSAAATAGASRLCRREPDSADAGRPEYGPA